MMTKNKKINLINKKIKGKSFSQLQKEADKVFSDYIRLRDKYTCFTCGKVGNKNDMQAGHYYSRTFKALRYDEINVNCQCVRCNIMLHGNIIEYHERLAEKYGDKKIEYLSGIKRLPGYKRGDLIIFIDYIKSRIRDFENWN
jgi:hypothetical protein